MLVDLDHEVGVDHTDHVDHLSGVQTSDVGIVVVGSAMMEPPLCFFSQRVRLSPATSKSKPTF